MKIRVCATCEHYGRIGARRAGVCRSTSSPIVGTVRPSDICGSHEFIKFSDGSPMNDIDLQTIAELAGVKPSCGPGNHLKANPICEACGMNIQVEQTPIRSTNGALNSPRGLIADKEATRDPIFLFQYRRWVMSPALDLEDFGYKVDDDGNVTDEFGEEVTNQELAEQEIFVETWETDRVFGTREESDAYGKRRGYDFPEGWRTFCVCAEGKLAELLVNCWS